MSCSQYFFALDCIIVYGCMCVLPDDSWCVPEDWGSKALSDAHQTGPIHLHDLVIHFDSGKFKKKNLSALKIR